MRQPAGEDVTPDPERKAQPASPPPAPAESPNLVEKFTQLPKVGDRFRGTVWFTDENSTLFVEIPGLSAEDYAAAMISPRDNPGAGKFKDGARVICRVLAVEKDPQQPNHWLVRCERE
jgi:hypothetical protein